MLWAGCRRLQKRSRHARYAVHAGVHAVGAVRAKSSPGTLAAAVIALTVAHKPAHVLEQTVPEGVPAGGGGGDRGARGPQSTLYRGKLETVTRSRDHRRRRMWSDRVQRERAKQWNSKGRRPTRCVVQLPARTSVRPRCEHSAALTTRYRYCTGTVPGTVTVLYRYCTVEAIGLSSTLA